LFERMIRASTKLIVVGLCASAALVTFGSGGQRTFQPANQLDVGNVVALDVSTNGSLLVADADDQSLLIYDIRNPSAPRLQRNIALDGTPVAAAWVNRDDSAAFVAVQTGDGSPILQLIARPTYNPRQGYILYATYDLVELPEAIATSPNGDWGALYGDSGLTLLEILSWDEINSSFISSNAVLTAALTNSSLLAAAPTSDELVTAQIGRGPALTAASSGTMSSEILTLNVDSSGTVHAVLLAPASVALLDVNRGSVLATQALNMTPPPTVITSASHDNGTWLIAYTPGESSAAFFETDGRTLTPAFILSTSHPIQHLSGANGVIATTDGETVDLYTP